MHQLCTNCLAAVYPHARVEYFQAALKWQGQDASYDEVECIVANLIFQKYIKGYISHKLRTVVLSKQDAFPPLSEIQLHDF